MVNKIIFGIDFGTTGTGVAFRATSKTNDHIHEETITTWPNRSDVNPSNKMPSEINYPAVSSSDASVTSDDTLRILKEKKSKKPIDCRVGYEIMAGEKRLQCFKLLHATGQKMPQFVSQHETKTEMLGNRRDHITATTDFFARLLKWIIEFLSQRFDADAMQEVAITYVLSVPAAFGQDAKNSICQAFRVASGEIPYLVAEPVAAAYQAVKDHRIALTPGDLVMILDAGGGTVDLALADVISVNQLEIKLREETAGDICGASLIDGAFENFVKKLLGHDKYDVLKRAHPGAWSDCLDAFRQGPKRTITASDDKEHPIPLRNVDSDALRHGAIPMKSKEVQELFDQSIEGTLKLVEKLAEQTLLSGGQPITHILMVGGLGGSRYFHSQLNARLDRQKIGNEKVRIMQSQFADSAVVNGILGAFIHGRCEKVPFSRHSIGVAINCSDFYEGKLGKRTPSGQDGEKVFWIIKRGNGLYLNACYEYKVTTQARQFDVSLYSVFKAVGDIVKSHPVDKLTDDPRLVFTVNTDENLIAASESDSKDGVKLGQKRKRNAKKPSRTYEFTFSISLIKGKTVLQVKEGKMGLVLQHNIPFVAET